MRTVATTLAAMALLAVPAPSAHAQQARCPESRTATGQCVDPDLDNMTSLRVLAFTQPKFSYTAPPFLPNADRVYRAPPDFHEVNTLLSYPLNPSAGVTITFDCTPSCGHAFVPLPPRP